MLVVGGFRCADATGASLMAFRDADRVVPYLRLAARKLRREGNLTALCRRLFRRRHQMDRRTEILTGDI